MNIQELDTPAVILEVDVLENNIGRLRSTPASRTSGLPVLIALIAETP